MTKLNFEFYYKFYNGKPLLIDFVRKKLKKN